MAGPNKYKQHLPQCCFPVHCITQGSNNSSHRLVVNTKTVCYSQVTCASFLSRFSVSQNLITFALVCSIDCHIKMAGFCTCTISFSLHELLRRLRDGGEGNLSVYSWQFFDFVFILQCETLKASFNLTTTSTTKHRCN
ncbi:hypothetical protein ILYODFUR_023946 [Ilyodon furcidens]|uniref:Uncharacterized protein n=1 Tax=Ilyodon furcidens TaxID=33524 RepID=A0ABV0SZP0_9TELE